MSLRVVEDARRRFPTYEASICEHRRVGLFPEHSNVAGAVAAPHKFPHGSFWDTKFPGQADVDRASRCSVKLRFLYVDEHQFLLVTIPVSVVGRSAEHHLFSLQRRCGSVVVGVALTMYLCCHESTPHVRVFVVARIT